MRTALPLLALFALAGCVAYPAEGYYAPPAPVHVAPPPAIYFGGHFGPTYRPRHWRHGHRHWR